MPPCIVLRVRSSGVKNPNLPVDRDYISELKNIGGLRFMGDPARASVVSGLVDRWNDAKGGTAFYSDGGDVTKRPHYVPNGDPIVIKGRPYISFNPERPNTGADPGVLGNGQGLVPNNLTISPTSAITIAGVLQLPPDFSVGLQYLRGRITGDTDVRALYTSGSSVVWRLGKATPPHADLSFTTSEITPGEWIAYMASVAPGGTATNFQIGTHPPKTLVVTGPLTTGDPILYMARTVSTSGVNFATTKIAFDMVFDVDLFNPSYNAARKSVGDFFRDAFGIANNIGS